MTVIAYTLNLFNVAMEIIRVEDDDLLEIEDTRCRIFRAISQALTAQVVWDDIQLHQRKRVIIICNTVSQSQGLYRDLEELNQYSELSITLLHARFLPEHRAQKETFLKEVFAQNWQKQNNKTCHILIATQVIEAGINITCEVMHTQLCPMSSLLQRGGRCARFIGEQGEVLVYRSIKINPLNVEIAEADFEPESEENNDSKNNLKEKFLPYKKETCELTWKVLQAHNVSGKVNENVGFRTEEEWINQVHAKEDSLQQQRRQNNRMDFENKFDDAVFRGCENTARDLIRSVDSRSLFVWQESSFIDFDDEELIDPQKLLAFSVPVSTLCKVWREFKESLNFGADWIFKRIEAPKKWKSETYAQPACTPINSRETLVNSIQILVNHRYTYYDENIGLLIGIDVFGNNFKSPEKSQRNTPSQYLYHMDNYVGHLVLMWKCWREPFKTSYLKNGIFINTQYNSVRDELLSPGGYFIKNKIFPQVQQQEAEALFEILVFLAIFTHDLGKLQVKWQEVMRGWQQIVYEQFKGRNPGKHLLAHTDYDPENKQQRDILKAYEKKHKRPNHAVESAFLAQEILKQSLVPLLRDYFTDDTEEIRYILYTVIMASGRHHSAWAQGWEADDVAKINSIYLHSDSQKVIIDSWRTMKRFLTQSLPLSEGNLSRNVYQVKEFDLNKLASDEVEYLQLYLLVVRALRLCDQRSVQLIYR